MGLVHATYVSSTTIVHTACDAANIRASAIQNVGSEGFREFHRMNPLEFEGSIYPFWAHDRLARMERLSKWYHAVRRIRWLMLVIYWGVRWLGGGLMLQIIWRLKVSRNNGNTSRWCPWINTFRTTWWCKRSSSFNNSDKGICDWQSMP